MLQRESLVLTCILFQRPCCVSCGTLPETELKCDRILAEDGFCELRQRCGPLILEKFSFPVFIK
jgi:hypothetical protein